MNRSVKCSENGKNIFPSINDSHKINNVTQTQSSSLIYFPPDIATLITRFLSYEYYFIWKYHARIFSVFLTLSLLLASDIIKRWAIQKFPENLIFSNKSFVNRKMNCILFCKLGLAELYNCTSCMYMI